MNTLAVGQEVWMQSGPHTQQRKVTPSVFRAWLLWYLTFRNAELRQVMAWESQTRHTFIL